MMKNENGRSMVEMLGVLAIIGVLSVGGIAGYTMAMNKYKANEILNTASMLAVLTRSGNGGQGVSSLTLSGAGLSAPYGDVDMTATLSGSAVTIGITGTGSDDVCSAVNAGAPTDNSTLYSISSCAKATSAST